MDNFRVRVYERIKVIFLEKIVWLKSSRKRQQILWVGLLLSVAAFLWVKSHWGKNFENLNKEELAHGKHVIHLSGEILKNYPLTLFIPKEMDPAEELILPGRVQYDPSQVGMISARAQGRLTALSVKEADRVKAGQLLGMLQSTELSQVEAEHLKILLRFNLMTQQFERSRDLFHNQIVSAKEHAVVVMEFKSAKTELGASRIHLGHLGLSSQDIARLEKDQKSSGELSIRSPLAGVIVEQKVSLGQLVKPEDTLFMVGNPDQVWVVLDVYEKDMSLVHEGQVAEIRLPYAPETLKRIEAQVARVSHVIDPITRSIKVWLEVKNSGGDLKFGQSMSAHLSGVAHSAKKIKGIPIEAVHKIEGKSIVFVQKNSHSFEAREVVVGWSSDRWVEIKEGLSSQESVVVEGSFILKSEYLKH